MTCLDKYAKNLLDEQEYFTTEQYRERAGLSASAAKRRLRLWVGEGLITRHYRGCPNHYTLPDSPPMLGREARWQTAAHPLLEQEGFLRPAAYQAVVVGQFSLADNRSAQRDLAAWVQGGRLQVIGPHGKGRIYLPAGIEPRAWTPKGVADGTVSRLHRWVIARRIVEDESRLTILHLAKRAGVSLDTAQHDVLQWVEEGWLERHGTGTHIYWRLPGQGPLNDHAPERRERVERLLAELRESGALTAEDAAELNHCSVGTARRDLNTLVFAGKGVRLKVGGWLMVWLSFPLPKALDWADWGGTVLRLAWEEEAYEGREDLLEQWQWNALRRELPVTAGEAARVWVVGAATARQRLAVLEAAGLLLRLSGHRYRPDQFALRERG